MKKSLLLAAVMLLTSVASFAQWVKPVPETQPLITDGETEQYLYNAAGGFLLGANDWNTRASISATKGYKWKVASTGEGTYSLTDYVETKSQWMKMFCDNRESIWVDNNAGANCDSWEIAVAGDIFYITNAGLPDDGKLAVAEDFSNDSRVYFESWFAENQIIQEFEWSSVSPEAYEAYLEKAAVYEAAMKLKAAIEEAEAKYNGIDLSSQKAIFNNPDSTVDQLTDALNSIDDAIQQWILNNLDKASLENPIDITSMIPYTTTLEKADGDSPKGWAVVFDTDSQNGSMKVNTWSNEGGSDGTGVLTPFLENWVSKGGILSDLTARHDIVTVRPGAYKIVANVRLYNESGAQDISGAYLFGNASRSDIITTGEMREEAGAEGYFEYNGMLGYHAPQATTYCLVGENGNLSFGIMCESANYNWQAAKDYHVLYLGQSDEAVQFVLDHTDIINKNYDEEIFANAEMISEYISAIETLESAASSIEDICSAYQSVSELNVTLPVNIKAYNQYQTEVEVAQEMMQTYEGVGVYVDLVNEYLSDEIEPGEAPESQVEEEKFQTFPNGSYAYILENKQMTTEQAVDEQAYLKDMIQVMKNKTPYVGMDYTDAIVNPNWTDANGKGWTEVTGKCTNKRYTGGLSSFPCAESWHSVFNFQQTVEGVPDGIYAISLNGFCRFDNGQTSVPAYIYMNDFATPLMKIGDGAIPEEEQQDGFNCFLNTDSWKSNPDLSSGYVIVGGELDTELDGGYVQPNGMVGASIAFSAGRYKATAYGLVEGGTMKIGVKNETDNAVWALWTNFKLTYMAKDPTAVEAVWNDLVEAGDEIITGEDDGYLSDALHNKINELILDEASYENVIELNAAINEARRHIAAYKQMDSALSELADAIINADENGQDKEVVATYEELWDRTSEAYDNKELSADDAENFLNVELPEAKARLSIIGDWTKADKDDPETWVNFSSLFNNNFDAGNINGWTFTTNGNKKYNGGVLEGEEEARCDKFIETWVAKTGSLDDGKMYTELNEIPYSFLSALPAGEYTLTADINSVRQGDETVSGGAFLYVENGEADYRAESFATGDGVPRTLSIDFAIAQGTEGIEFGIKLEDCGYNWIAADNFKLVLRNYNPEQKPLPTGIGTVIADETVISAPMMYNLAGQRISKLQKGLNIVNGQKILK